MKVALLARKGIQRALAANNLQITRRNQMLQLGEIKHDYEIWRDWIACSEVKPELLAFILRNSKNSKSQIQQDLLAEWIQKSLKSDGEPYFVEFGATNGFDISNTYQLEKKLNWNGIVAEPARKWHSALKQNRSCFVDLACVYSRTGEVIEFKETIEGEYSTIARFVEGDNHAAERRKGVIYEVETISLLDLLKKYDAPTEISYLSIDTEGSEFEILATFAFPQYSFNLISVEHNYTESQQKIEELLVSNGYINIFRSVSKFEDWYVSSSVYEELFLEK